ncbi:MAG TPA: hypothetical protein VGC05_22050 [Mycobacterium sp.]
MKKKIVALIALTFAAVLVTAPAAWAAPPYTNGVDHNSGAPGAVITYTATTTEPPTTTPVDVVVTPDVDDLQTASEIHFFVGAGGVIRFSFKIPAAAPNGQVFVIDVHAGRFVDTQSVTAVVPARSGLPATGVDAAPYLWFGGGLLALGIALVVVLAVVRRSRKAPPAHV